MMENERVLYSHCPLCDSKNISHFHKGDCSKSTRYKPQLSPSIEWSKCTDCEHVFTEGYYSEEALNIVFEETVDSQIVGAGLEKNRAVSARMIDKVLPFQDSGIWLDVGCGNGSLMFTAAEYGFTPLGLDLRQHTVSAMKRLGFECYKKDICEFDYDKKASVISMADVLEHTHYPKECLKSAKTLLKKGGIIFLSMPNSDAFIWNVFTKKNINPYWGEMEHYHNFSRKRLYALLEELDFKILRYGVSERYRICMEIIAVLK
jgi:SAM-dependent methyltransferase